MGNSTSNEHDDGYNPESNDDGAASNLDQFDGVETLGYRVLGVQPNSPASQSGLVSFFDFLVGANGQMLLGSGEGLEEGDEYDDVDFPALLEEFKGKPLELLVWNIKYQKERLVEITPNDNWDGAGLLGVTIRLDNYAGAEERLIRILEVEPNSPAAVAGLISSKDYLLGTTTHSFDSTQVLAMILDSNVDRVVELYVYNTTSDKVRVVALMPTFSWGGRGLLGAEVGTGYLHRLPSSCRDSLGGSVERKVRWVTAESSGPTGSAESATANNQQTTATEATPASSSQQQPPQAPSQQKPGDESQQPQQQSQSKQQQQQQQQQVTVEMEPQLEMEPQEGGPVHLQGISSVSESTVSQKYQEQVHVNSNENNSEKQRKQKPDPIATGTGGSEKGTSSSGYSSAPTSGNLVTKNLAEAVFSCSSPAEAHFTYAEAEKVVEPQQEEKKPEEQIPTAFRGPPLSSPDSNNSSIPVKNPIVQIQASVAPPLPAADNNHNNYNETANDFTAFVPPPPKMSFMN